MNAHADRMPKSESQSLTNSSSREQRTDESSLLFSDNRPTSVSHKKLQDSINNKQKVSQLKSLGHSTNEPIQFVRGKTKYGAMMDSNEQGPHTIAHSTIATIESMFQDNPMDKYVNYQNIGIILSIDQVQAELQQHDQQEDDPEWLQARYQNYLIKYEELLGNCEYWYSEAQQNTPMDDEDNDEYFDALHELDLAINDIRDMHPASTYAGDIFTGATQEMMDGKGERAGYLVSAAINALDRNDYDGLHAEIMRDADTENLESNEAVEELAWSYVDLAIQGLGWDPR